MPSSAFACQPRPVCVCSSAATSTCRWPLSHTQQQRCRSRHHVAVRAARFENRELLVGDCTSLLSFCLYKQVAVQSLAAVHIAAQQAADFECVVPTTGVGPGSAAKLSRLAGTPALQPPALCGVCLFCSYSLRHLGGSCCTSGRV